MAAGDGDAPPLRWQLGAAWWGGPRADDRRMVILRGLPGQAMRSKLPDLLKPVLDRSRSRLERFARNSAVGSALSILKTEGDAASVVWEFSRDPVAV